jgi:hypothetical protein
MRASPRANRVVVVTSDESDHATKTIDQHNHDDDPESNVHTRKRWGGHSKAMMAAPSSPDLHWKKFARYSLEVDEDQDDKATEILLCSAARPHMR